MTDHHGDTEEQVREHAEEDAEPRFERPDKAGPRGNPETEETDVERGRGKLDRVSGN